MQEIIVQDSELLPGLMCHANESIGLRGVKIDFMYREPPSEENDSGWYFQDTQEEASKPSNHSRSYPLASILATNLEILGLLNAPYYSAFERNADSRLVVHFDETDQQEKDHYQQGLQLIDVICDAFRDVHLEDGTSFHQAIARDHYDDVKKARLLDTDSHWSQVELMNVRYNGVGGMCFMDAKGFRYYLPAFMIFELRYPRMGNNFGLDFHLHKKGEDQFSDRFKILNHMQNVAVRKFLEHQVMDCPIHYGDALRSYWHQFKY